MSEREHLEGVSTAYWHSLEDGRIQCDLCPRFCKLKEGQRGLCFVRGRQDNQIVLTTYGRSSGFCIDPIEKKPLNHFLPGTSVLSFGTAGCNLACKFCQNWDMSKSREMDTLADQAEPELVADMAERMGAHSIAFTYNDPINIAKACRERGIRTVGVSSGYVSQGPREAFYAHMDAVNIDLKAFTERFYKRPTGSELGPVLDTIRYIHHETDVWMELTTLLIPGENDSTEEIETMVAWVRDELGPEVTMHFTAFHPDFKMLDHAPTPPATLARARAIALDAGIRYAYTGNVQDKAGQSTYCHHCGQLLIGRDWFQLSDWNLDAEGRCTACGTACAGVFESGPGRWGARRLPVRPGTFRAELESAGGD
ncbi:MAG: AmmeMemoRadiSam system radical SAM enzyme [Thiohalorhabdaceae bacterium]